MFLKSSVTPHLMNAFETANDSQRAHLYVVEQALDRKFVITASAKPLNRYSIQPGKTFATSPSDKQKYKVLRVLADDIVVQDMQTRKIQTFQVNNLLKDWTSRGIKEVSALEDIIQTVKSLLGPVLGIFLTTALISWLTEKLR